MQKIELQNRKSQNIVGNLELPSGEVKGTCILQHGYGSDKNSKTITTVREEFLNLGFQTFSFDTTNSFNESDGDYEDARQGLHCEDLEDVVKWSQKQDWFTGPLALSGHSMGGYAVIRYTQDHPEKVNFLVPVAPVVSGALILQAYKRHKPNILKEWKETGMYERESTSKPGVIRRQHWDVMEEWQNHDLLPDADKIKVPILMIVGSEDTSCTPQDVKSLYDAMVKKGEESLFYEVQGSPHSFRIEEDLSRLREVVSEGLSHLLNNYDARKALLIAVNSKNEVLIQDRRNHKKPDWGYFGGGIEQGETSLQAVIRETKEELDLDIKENDLIYMGDSYTEWDGHTIMRYLYLYKTDQEDFTVLEGKGAHWMNHETAKEYLEDEDRFNEMVERIKEYYK